MSEHGRRWGGGARAERVSVEYGRPFPFNEVAVGGPSRRGTPGFGKMGGAGECTLVRGWGPLSWRRVDAYLDLALVVQWTVESSAPFPRLGPPPFSFLSLAFFFNFLSWKIFARSLRQISNFFNTLP